MRRGRRIADGEDEPLSSVPQLIRFHLRVGVRVALRTLVPIVAGVVFAAVMYGSVLTVLAPVRAALFPPAASIASALLAVALSGAVAAATAPRLATGLSGWIRHLPASGVDHRRALTAGLVVAQAPVLAVVVAGGLLSIGDRTSTSLPRLVGLLPLAWGSTLAVLPIRHRWARLAALVGAAAAWVGSWEALALAAPLLGVAEWTAGPLDPAAPKRYVGRRADRGGRWTTAAERPPSAARLWLVIAWRALRWRMVAGWLVVPTVLVPMWLFLRNNRLESGQDVLAVRLCGVVAAVVAMAVLADGLVRRRPPWPWIRSLPWSAGARVACDAVLLGSVALPVMIAAAAMAPQALLPMIATLPVIALRGSAAMRDGVGRTVGASGPLLLEGLLVAGLVALLPWAAVAVAALTPVGWRVAIERERRQPISRWHELHYLASGDSLSWSGS
jgi:hypothetical protein